MLRLAFDFIITWRETRTRPNAYNRKGWTGGTFGNLCDTKVSTQSCKSDLFTHHLHLLLQFSWQLGTHCTFCHSSTYHIICKYKCFTLLYDVLQKSIFEFNLAVIYLVISSDIEIYYIIHRVYISTYIISKKITIFWTIKEITLLFLFKILLLR